MTRRIDLRDATAERLAQLQALTGRSVDDILDSALRAQLAQAETDVLQAAVQLGATEADAGAFTDRTVEQIFAQGMAQAKQVAPNHD